MFGRKRVRANLESVRAGLIKHVDVLAGLIGIRNTDRYSGLQAAAAYIERTYRDLGYAPQAHEYLAAGKDVRNIEAEIKGAKHPERILILGAHYDSVDCPAANDNASGVAGVLEIARLFARLTPAITLRFVNWVNEEPPFYKGPRMGSTVYAKRCRERNENILGVINLETIGCYFDQPHTQRYPYPLDRGLFRRILPSRGNFVVFAGNLASWRFTWKCRRLFKRAARFPAWWIAAPDRIEGPGMSDHWSFWQQGYSALMVTDTAYFRYDHYHKPTDTPDQLNYPAMAHVVSGIAELARRLTCASSNP